jgi:hypothetical protein
MSDLSSFLDQLANRFSEGWHDGIKIDATDIVDMGKAADHIRKLEAKVARVKQEKADALNVRSKDGLLSSEWIARTGAAERRAEAAEAKLRAVAELPEEWRTAIDQGLTLPAKDCADELEALLMEKGK